MADGVLLTGVGAPGTAGTIYALRNNPENRKVWIVGVDMNEEAVGKYMVDDFSCVPPPESETYIYAILDICEKKEVRVVLPQTTREVEALSKSKEVFEQNGVSIAVSDHQTVKIANNKFELLKAFDAIDLPVPRFSLASTREELVEIVNSFGYPSSPVVVKPPRSNGMRGVRILRESAWDVQRFLEEKPDGLEIELSGLLKILDRGDGWPSLLVTEYLPGAEYTVDVFRGTNAFIAIPRKRLSIRSGITFKTKIEWHHQIMHLCQKISNHLGLRYAFGFQFKMDTDGVPKILECNPRIQGTMVAAMTAGYNIPWLAVKDALGEPISIEPPKNENPPSESMFYRYWGGIGLSGGNVIIRL